MPLHRPASRLARRESLPCLQEEVAGPYGWATLHAHVREVAVHISNYTVRVGDRGVVVVGGSVELGEPALWTTHLMQQFPCRACTEEDSRQTHSSCARSIQAVWCKLPILRHAWPQECGAACRAASK